MIATLATKEIPKINTGSGLEMRVFFSNGSGRQIGSHLEDDFSQVWLQDRAIFLKIGTLLFSGDRFVLLLQEIWRLCGICFHRNPLEDLQPLVFLIAK
jgi:uncharacterized membrane protein YgdD (TMEM256/DUF423 family)